MMARMQSLPAYQRILLLTEGHFGVFTSKTAASLLRYRAADVVGVLDAAVAGQDPRRFVPWSPDVPILPSVAAATALRPEAVFVGIAPVGGALPASMRTHLRDALAAGIDVVSGLHTRITADAELRNLAAARAARIFDVREPPPEQPIAAMRAVQTPCRRILTVGSDCNVGKMVAALELAAAARRRGLNARFAATGQTGIMIAGCGVAIDAVVCDFAAGAAEALVVALGDCEVCFVEGQGSIAHPGYSGVTLSLLHGVCPDALVLVHHLGRERYTHPPRTPLPALGPLIAAYEQAAAFLHPAKVVAVALNGHGSGPEAVAAAAHAIERDLGLPAADVLSNAAAADRLLAAAL